MQDFLPAEQATAFLELYKKKAVRQNGQPLLIGTNFALVSFSHEHSFILRYTHFLYLTNEVIYCKILSYGKNNLRYRS